MPRAALSEHEIDQFRESLCEVALRRFAEQGYAGVTLRGLASDLGCSPMTPYRYFENKAAIFEAVRAMAFGWFGERLAEAQKESDEPVERLRALGRAYVRFALDEPHAYRIMFELDPSEVEPPGQPVGDEKRSWNTMHRAVEQAVEAGLFDEDADVLAHLFWSGVHGLVTLHLAGKLVLGRRLDDLLEPFMDRAIGPDPNARKE
jgi:AcrR family transcriptional regulator